jgi:hypothetical protein
MTVALDHATVEAIARRVVELLRDPTATEPTVKRRPERPDILEAVRAVLARGPATADQVQSAVRRRRIDVRAALRTLEEAGEVDRRADGRWRACPVAGNGTGSVATERPSTAPAYVLPLCPDEAICRYRSRHASGPWGCRFNHPREGADA